MSRAMLSSVECVLQDLSGFDDNIKAVHGTPSKRGVSFGHSISMPVPRNRAGGQPPPRWALSRSATGISTPGEGLLSSRSTPSVQVDSGSAFNGFPTMQCVEVGRPCFYEPSEIHIIAKSLPSLTDTDAATRPTNQGAGTRSHWPKWLDPAGALLQYVCPDQYSLQIITSEIQSASCPDDQQIALRAGGFVDSHHPKQGRG